MRNLFDDNFDKDSVKVELVVKPKEKLLDKIRINKELFYLVENDNEYIVYSNNSKVKKDNKVHVIASIFNKAECKYMDYIQLESYYVDSLIKYNEGYYHSNYITCSILDVVYKYLVAQYK